jgi:hypothetical protein
MKKIPLTKGQFALVDDEDFEWLNQWKWLYGGRRYAARNTHFRDEDGKRHTKVIWMHREIIKTPASLKTDHINGNGLDNRKSNLRVVTQQQNTWNLTKPSHNTTGYKGVYWRANRWEAAIHKNNKKYHLGRFTKLKEAIVAYNNASLKFFGEYAKPNQI